ncbi:hypothetical protein V5O48_004237 [Marasmius crinis-equi]|uniref:Uncharacterized protein n=1 Tax=Marasmius crinis-equi TaxID=585013 RepID=A0ABR3FQV6_9AGAR
MEQTVLRILYSTNDSTQYTLARSRSLVPIYRLTTISDDQESASQGAQTRYASVSVKDCIDTLCLSSPDLIQDRTRDFSVYHLDPLESVGPAGSSGAATGVPVGLGLMSALRSADGNLPLTGTLTKLRTGLEGLEVVFTLREIRHSTARISRASSSVASLPQAGPSGQYDAENPNIAAALARQRSQQEMHTRRLMRESKEATDKRLRNRQLGYQAARCDVAESLLAGAGNYHVPNNAKNKSKSEEPPSEAFSELSHLPSPPTSQPHQPQPSSSSQPAQTTGPSAQPTQPSPTVPDAATLLAVMGLIDERGGAAQLEGNVQLQDALKQLFSQYLAHNSPPNPSQDDEVVALDKENVNPDAFHKRARELVAAKSAETSASVQRPATPEAHERPAQGLGLGGRSNSLPFVKEKSRTVSNSSENRSGGSRKGKERAKDSIYHSFSNGNPSVPWSSPPRARSGGDDYGGIGSSRRTPIVIPDSPCTPKAARVPASSPIRGTKQKRYVMPEWARTSTATQPKFSEEFQRAREEVERRREAEMKAKRKSWGSARSKSASCLQEKTAESTHNPATDNKPDERPPTPPPLPSSQPVIASSSQPFFALPVCAASTSPFICPKTPPRKRPRSPSQSPLNRSGSLFTPKNSSFAGFGSPLFSPSYRARKVIKSDPVHPPATQVHLDADEIDSQGDVDDALTRELDSALDEIGLSSSSLPVASSDAETDSAPGEDVDVTSDNEDGDGTYPRKQYWPGLPPSSPLPSSPMLQDDLALPPADTPLEDDDDDAQLPVVTSDVEEDMVSPGEDRTPMNSDTPDAGPNAIEGQATATSNPDSESDAIFALFTNISSTTSDPPEFDWNLQGDMGGNMNLEDMDFTQFWESVKPLLNEQQQQQGAAPGGDVQVNNEALNFDLGQDAGILQLLEGGGRSGVDTKFADDIISLYSGCVM